MGESQLGTPRKAVTIKGQLISMAILGTTVVTCIFIENFRVAEWSPYILHIIGGGLVLAVAVPMLFFRRPVE